MKTLSCPNVYTISPALMVNTLMRSLRYQSLKFPTEIRIDNGLFSFRLLYWKTCLDRKKVNIKMISFGNLNHELLSTINIMACKSMRFSYKNPCWACLFIVDESTKGEMFFLHELYTVTNIMTSGASRVECGAQSRYQVLVSSASAKK